MQTKDKSKLIDWLNYQRYLHRIGQLTKEQQHLLELLPNWAWDIVATSVEKKKQLLEIAKNGKKKPHYSTKLGSALHSYTYKSQCYDPTFDEEIRKLAPHWFVKECDENKKKLLEMVTNGEQRPNGTTTKLGKALSLYTCKSSNSYDPIFDKKIRSINEEWLGNQSNRAAKKKKELLCIGMNKGPRPTHKHPLGNVLCSYTNKSCKCYDPVFDKEIRRIASQWFVPQSEVANKNKEKILQAVFNKQIKKIPHYKTKLGKALKNYMHNDHKFNKKIRHLLPISREQKAITEAEEVFSRAKERGHLPKRNTKDKQENKDASYISTKKLAKNGKGGCWYIVLDDIAKKCGFQNIFDTVSCKQKTLNKAEEVFSRANKIGYLPKQCSKDKQQVKDATWINRIRQVKLNHINGFYYIELDNIAKKYGFYNVFETTK